MNPHHPTLHPLLLLSDSALPLGSFAFSSGLESYLAHTKYFSAHLVTDFSSNGPTHSPSRPVSRGPPKGPTAHQLMQFLKQSVHNSASTLIPFLLGGWHRPEMLLELDDALDAATPCTVARRASTAQGKALGVVWSRALRSGCEIPFSDDDYSSGQDREGLKDVDGVLRVLRDVDGKQEGKAGVGAGTGEAGGMGGGERAGGERDARGREGGAGTEDGGRGDALQGQGEMRKGRGEEMSVEEGPQKGRRRAWNEVEGYVTLLGGMSGKGTKGGTGQTRDGGVDALMEIVPQGHLPPLFGAVSRAMGLGEADAAYVFLLNHVKAVLSAMVRAGVMGPYQSQGVLAGREVGKWISEAIADVKARGGRIRGASQRKAEMSEEDVWALVESAGVSIPAMDLWMGRHELLYSRIFNS